MTYSILEQSRKSAFTGLQASKLTISKVTLTALVKQSMQQWSQRLVVFRKISHHGSQTRAWEKTSSLHLESILIVCVCMCVCVCVCISSSVVSDSLRPHGLQFARLLCPWDSSGKNTRVGCHSLLQGCLPNPEIKPRYPALQAVSLPGSHQGRPYWYHDRHQVPG